MANKEFPNDIYDKLSLFITNKKWIERLTMIPPEKAKKDHMKIPELIDKAQMKNKQIRTQLNAHIRFDDLIKDIESGRVRMKRADENAR